MTKPITAPGAKLIIKLGDGATPEVFTAPCGINTRGINFTKATNETNVPDCADPEAPSWTERGIVSMSTEVSGNGVLAMENLTNWQAFLDSTVSKNCQIWIDVPSTDHGGHWDGKFHLTGFNVTGEIGNKVQAAITMQSDGPVTWTPVP